MAPDRRVANSPSKDKRRSAPYRLLAMTVSAVTAALALSIAAEGEAVSLPTSSLSKGGTFEEEGGEALYAKVCAGCHQPDARGASGAADYPSLADDKDLASVDYLERLLLKGQRGMPALGQMMSDRQVADVINYVRSHFGNAYGEDISPAEVEAARRQAGSTP